MLNAFENYLLNIGPKSAVEHFIVCFKDGESTNLAWDIMIEIRGPNWSCKPEDLSQYVFETLNMLFNKRLNQGVKND